MTYRIVGEEFIDGEWLEFATLKCDWCGEDYTKDGLGSESGEVAMATFEGWTRWPYRDGPMDVCHDCRELFTAPLRQEPQ